LRWTAHYSLSFLVRSFLLVERRVWVKGYLYFAVEQARCRVVGGRRQVVVADAEEAAVLEEGEVTCIIFEF
jgi:hypothetical protein